MRHALLGYIIIFLSLFSSCNNDDNSQLSSRVIEYEVSGSFSGSIFASYTKATGGTTNEQINLPWGVEITYAPNVTAAIIALSGNGGSSGQQITVLVKRGGTQISTTPITVGSSGSFSKAAPVVIF